MRGYSVVLGPSLLEWFISIVVVIIVTFIVAKCLYDGKGKEKKKNVSENNFAKCSTGIVKTFDVPDKEAALLMAIVADRLRVPLGELKFISIKEVKEEEENNEIQSNIE